MSLLRVDIRGVRNIHSEQLQLCPNLNIITGENASGKTSILEAVYLLAHGKSFRTHHIREVIQHDQQVFQLFGLVDIEQRQIPVGIERNRNERPKIKIAGTLSHRIADLTRLIPIQVMTPESHSLIEASPIERRSFVDWGVFHVEHSYVDLWQNYRHTLKQRNAALRMSNYDKTMDRFWVNELISLGEEIGKRRAAYFSLLRPYLEEHLQYILNGLEIGFSLTQGWPANLNLSEAFAQGYERDRKQGFTHSGPHRADIKIKVDGKSASQVLSRGQQKLVVCAMKLAQVGLLNSATSKQTTILIDDLPAELDEDNRGLLFALLSRLQNQILVTATDQNLISLDSEGERAMFHVEHGVIKTG